MVPTMMPYSCVLPGGRELRDLSDWIMVGADEQFERVTIRSHAVRPAAGAPSCVIPNEYVVFSVRPPLGSKPGFG